MTAVFVCGDCGAIHATRPRPRVWLCDPCKTERDAWARREREKRLRAANGGTASGLRDG